MISTTAQRSQAGFQSRPQVTFEGSKVRLLAPVTWLSRDRTRGIVLPAGFTCDLDSRPGWLPGFVRYWMASAVKAAGPATLHDYLYKYGGYWTPGGKWVPVSKGLADGIFYEALEIEREAWAGTDDDEDESAVSSWLFWGGVAAGGWRAWYRHRRDDKRVAGPR